MPLDIAIDPIDLTAALVDIPSVSHDEERIADEVEAALRALDRFEVLRVGNNVLARTDRGLPQRVMLAGHLDTVPIADNVPSRREGGVLHGCGTVDMKSGDAVFLHLAATMADPAYDLTLIFYECEEIASQFNGLGRIERELPAWLRADVAILGEPSGGLIEAGCQGTIRVRITASGVRAHSARSWLGDNAIHKLGPVLTALQAYTARTVDIDGCEYREGLSAVAVGGGVAGNVIPDAAHVDVNFRFAPDRTSEEALEYMKSIIGEEEDVTIDIDDIAPAAQPGLCQPAAKALIDAVGGNVRAKFGWTDVARFSEMGTPAVNFGAGDPGFAHKKDEQVPTAQITEVSTALLKYLKG